MKSFVESVSVRLIAGALLLSWSAPCPSPSNAPRVFIVQQSTNLVDWSNVGGFAQFVGQSNLIFCVPLDGGAGFVRVFSWETPPE